MSKADVKWSHSIEDENFDAALRYLSLLMSADKADALVRNLQITQPINHAAKDLLRAAQLPLLPRNDSHVDDDLKWIGKGKPLPPVLLVRGEIARSGPLVMWARE